MAFTPDAALNMDSFNAALKEHYHGLRIKDLVYKNNPLLALMPKYERFGGKYMPVPLKYGNPQGRSAAFDKAQGNTSATTSLDAFQISHVRDYCIARIDALTIDAARGDADAFVRAATIEIDSAISSLSNTIAFDIYRNGSGARGRLSADPGSGQTFTLATTADVVNFEVGMSLVFADPFTDSDTIVKPNALRSATPVVISGINRDTGVVTFTGSIAAGVDSGDFVFVEGDYTAQGDTLKLDGLEAWVPQPLIDLSTSFNNVTRNADATRLGGQRFDGSSSTVRESILDAAARVAREGGSPDHCFMSFENYVALEKELMPSNAASNTAVTAFSYDVKTGATTGTYGFTGLQVQGPAGPIKVVADKNCQSDLAWLLQMDTWTLNSAGSAPKILDHDGNRLLRVSDNDQIEIRIGFYGNVSCSAPGWNCRIALS